MSNGHRSGRNFEPINRKCFFVSLLAMYVVLFGLIVPIGRKESALYGRCVGLREN